MFNVEKSYDSMIFVPILLCHYYCCWFQSQILNYAPTSHANSLAATELSLHLKKILPQRGAHHPKPHHTIPYHATPHHTTPHPRCNTQHNNRTAIPRHTWSSMWWWIINTFCTGLVNYWLQVVMMILLGCNF